MAKRVTTATLIRGQIYNLRHPDNRAGNPVESLRFKHGVPVVIEDPKIVKVLEDIYDESTDGDGELYEKPVFRIDRNVAEPDGETKPRAKRLSSDRQVKTKRRRIA